MAKKEVSPSEKITLVRNFVGWGLKRDVCLKLVGITKHAYYYKPRGRKNAGLKPSTYTKKLNKEKEIELVSNEELMDEIIETMRNSDLAYGYRTMTAHLQIKGYLVNHKKVYRLMDSYQLLNEAREKSEKNFVKFRRVTPNGPLEVMEMDLKLEWITSLERYAYIFSVIDCFTRKVLYWKVALSIKKQDVKDAWEYIVIHYLQEKNMLEKQIKIEVRNDNDKRFEAKLVKDFFTENHINQVFTHPYTPQENGHIESFHAILGRSLEEQYYITLSDLEDKLKAFYETYNNVRLHGSLDRLSPNMFWQLWEMGLIEKTEGKRGKTKFKLRIPHHSISGKLNLRSFPVPVCA